MKNGINEDYMKWLANFSKDNPICTDVEDMYLPDSITEEDKRNINKLDDLFELVDNYAQLNGIDSYMFFDVFKCYKLRHNDVGYEISASLDNTFCERIAVENKEDFIDFYDIITFVNSKEKRDKEASLISLRTEVQSLISQGISVTLIKKTLKKELTSGRRTF